MFGFFPSFLSRLSPSARPGPHIRDSVNNTARCLVSRSITGSVSFPVEMQPCVRMIARVGSWFRSRECCFTRTEINHEAFHLRIYRIFPYPTKYSLLLANGRFVLIILKLKVIVMSSSTNYEDIRCLLFTLIFHSRVFMQV